MKVTYYNSSIFSKFGKHSVIQTTRYMVNTSHVVDRTGHANNFNFVYDPIPTNFDNVLSWKECCLKRAEELWKIEKPITLLYSGGIDSTVAFCALRETKKENDDLIVRLTQDSIDEYPLFYKDSIQWFQQFVTKQKLLEHSLFKQDRIFITGECGDQCFGSDSLNSYMHLASNPWQDCVNILQETIPQSVFFQQPQDKKPEIYITSIIKNIMDFLEEHIKYAPFEIKTVFDLYWWLNFSLKWTDVDVRIIYVYANYYDNSKTYSFFNTEDFQKWSITNHNIKHNNTWASYKQPSKDFIYEYTKDDIYQKNKTKEPSLKKLHTQPRRPKGKHWKKDFNVLKLVLDDGQYWYNKDTIPLKIIEEVWGKNPPTELKLSGYCVKDKERI